MESVKFIENGLNVEYISHFIEKEYADRYFAELRTLPFFRPTLKIRGKAIKPKRMTLAYGDDNVSYGFSGTSIPANPWTPLMIELRDKVEKQTACTYNYVLLNFYKDGSDYISQHKDNESSLDATFPIAVLSFGGVRTIEFQRPDVPSTSIDLEHGSFYSMEPPTNKLFSHGIAPDPANKDMRISLTFRHIIPSPSPMKKPRLDTSDDFPQNDWFTKLCQDIEIYTVGYWNIGWNTIVVVQMKNCNLKIDIRNYNEGFDGELFPTKHGIVMLPITFDMFQQKLSKFNFHSVKDTFVSNNQLLTAFIDENFCLLQQIFKSNENSFHFKPEGLRLSKDQFLKLDEISSEINDCLIEMILTEVIPQTILKKIGDCNNHLTLKEARENFFTCFNSELERSVYNIFPCYSCSINQLLNHDCLNTSLREKFLLYKDSALINFNVYHFVKRLTEKCLCHYDSMFFQSLNITFYKVYMETVFVNQK